MMAAQHWVGKQAGPVQQLPVSGRRCDVKAAGVYELGSSWKLRGRGVVAWAAEGVLVWRCGGCDCVRQL